MLPNRIAVYFTAAAALIAAALPVLANFDTASTIGIIGGVGAMAGIIATWLYNWGKYEERTALEPLIEEQLNVDRPESVKQGTTLGRP